MKNERLEIEITLRDFRVGERKALTSSGLGHDLTRSFRNGVHNGEQLIKRKHQVFAERDGTSERYRRRGIPTDDTARGQEYCRPPASIPQHLGHRITVGGTYHVD